MRIFVAYRIHVYDMGHLMLLYPLCRSDFILIFMTMIGIGYLNHQLRHSLGVVGKIILLFMGFTAIISFGCNSCSI